MTRQLLSEYMLVVLHDRSHLFLGDALSGIKYLKVQTFLGTHHNYGLPREPSFAELVKGYLNSAPTDVAGSLALNER